MIVVDLKLKDGTELKAVKQEALKSLLATGNVIDAGEPYEIAAPAPTGFADPKEFDRAIMPGNEPVRPVPVQGEPVGRFLRRPLAKTLAGIESIPQELAAIDVSTQFPFIGIHGEKAAALDKDVTARYERIVNQPNFLESVLTDPLTYLPGAGQLIKGVGLAAKTGKVAMDPILQGAAEYAMRPDLTKSEAGIAAGVGAGTTVAAGKAGKVISKLSLDKFGKLFGFGEREAGEISSMVPNLGSTRKAVEKASSSVISTEEVARYAQNPQEELSILLRNADDASKMSDEFRAGTPWSRQYSINDATPTLADARKWESKIQDFRDDVVSLIKANKGKGLSEPQVAMLLKTYSDVPALANELRTMFVRSPWKGPIYERYLGKTPESADMSILGLTKGLGKKAVSPENLTREARFADYLAGRSGIPVAIASSAMDDYLPAE